MIKTLLNPDKKNLYTWIVVLLANIGVVPIFGLFSIYEGGSFFDPRIFIVLGIFSFLSIVPILISKGYNKLKNLYGYGIPALLLLPIPYFIYDYYTCHSTFCEIVPVVAIMCLGLSAVIFAFFYTIGIYVRKLNVKFVLSLMLIEIFFLILLPLVYYFGFACKFSLDSDRCHIDMAKSIDNLPFCEEIIDKSSKDVCYHDLARENNNSEYCEKIIEQQYKDACYYNLARENNSSAYCGKVIGDQLFREQCYSMVENQKINSEPDKELTDSEVNDGWKKFNDSENGFSIEYPIDFEIRKNGVRIEYLIENTEYIKNSRNELVIDFSPNGYINPKNEPKEGLLVVKIYNTDDYTIDQLIKTILVNGYQRTEKREGIKIGNIDALYVTINYNYVKSDGSLVPDTYEIIFIQGDEKIYALPRKDDYKYPNIYEAFYKSFRFL